MATRFVSRPFVRNLSMATRTAARLSYASLSDENQRLRLQLQNADVGRRRAEILNSDLQSRVQQAESAVVQQLRKKEADWMNEYDRNVQALLQIIKHHEDERDRLMTEIQQLREEVAVTPPAIVKVARSTQTQILPRTNSVRFAKDESDALPDKEKKLCTSSKVNYKFDKMQQLFEQLQTSKGNGRIDRQNAFMKNGRVGLGNSRCEHCSQVRRDFKISILERLGASKTEATAEERQSPTAQKRNEDDPTEISPAEVHVEAPAPKQMVGPEDNKDDSTEIPNTPQQDLEECNRLLLARLASQQRVLDHLLHTKLQHADTIAEKLEHAHLQNITSGSAKVQVCNAVGRGQRPDNLEFTVHTTDALIASTQGEEATRNSTTERRPLSPPAA